jgi:citrate lyase subunit beta / citryl-CoA lyase
VRRRRPLVPPTRAEPSQTEIDQTTAVVSAVGKAEARGDEAANLNGMVIDAATTRIFEVTLDRARRCGLPA